MPALDAFSLDGRTALVTGAGSGIAAFAGASTAVLVTDVDPDAAGLVGTIGQPNYGAAKAI
jgi:3-oxoacyl-[acyl-carrier protein] reductase